MKPTNLACWIVNILTRSKFDHSTFVLLRVCCKNQKWSIEHSLGRVKIIFWPLWHIIHDKFRPCLKRRVLWKKKPVDEVLLFCQKRSPTKKKEGFFLGKKKALLFDLETPQLRLSLLWGRWGQHLSPHPSHKTVLFGFKSCSAFASCFAHFCETESK